MTKPSTALFTAEEKALLAFAEEVALISWGGVSNAVYQQATALPSAPSCRSKPALRLLIGGQGRG
ncbi:carboxymuconolactone decarboxylase family protein [Hymenobacter metallicola]|uniref:Uncharacterized protein n=1 Tax=Hymenobacter metallicola TaxID=2563114 RepID=A0A4Z0PTN8_9BACT|nr:hypothetical protein [Hymenobacter metallicola]TGE21067.1 hypothetical protein E5K02_23945 [Hymenobacter metallicola]